MVVITVSGYDLQVGDVILEGGFRWLAITHVERPGRIRFNSGGATVVGPLTTWLIARLPTREAVIRDLVRIACSSAD